MITFLARLTLFLSHIQRQPDPSGSSRVRRAPNPVPSHEERGFSLSPGLSLAWDAKGTETAFVIRGTAVRVSPAKKTLPHRLYPNNAHRSFLKPRETQTSVHTSKYQRPPSLHPQRGGCGNSGTAQAHVEWRSDGQHVRFTRRKGQTSRTTVVSVNPPMFQDPQARASRPRAPVGNPPRP